MPRIRRPPHQIKAGLVYFASVIVLFMTLMFWAITTHHALSTSLILIAALIAYVIAGVVGLNAYCRRNP